MDKKRQPLGVLILGGLNCLVFGLLFLVIFTGTYFKTTPQDLHKVIELFKNKGMTIAMTYRQFKVINLMYVFISSVFLLSGWGILRKKEWARKLTVYFSFVWIFFIFLAVLFNLSLIAQLIVYVIYPGALIMYFTSKKIENYFKNESSINITQMICPNANCGYRGEPKKEPRGSTAVGCLLCLFFLLPGIIYFMFKGGYRYICPKCGLQIKSDA